MKYYDKHKNEITEGCFVRFDDGRIEKIYLTEDNELGTDATNKTWIEKGRAVECEYGIYPLDTYDCEHCEVITTKQSETR